MPRFKYSMSFKPIELIMLPFIPNHQPDAANEDEPSTGHRLSPDSLECFKMANVLRKTRGYTEPVLYLGALPGSELWLLQRSLHQYFARAILSKSSITFVAHGNPEVLGTRTGYSITPEELASNVHDLFTSIMDLMTAAGAPELKRDTIKTRFEFQHCNSGLYPEKTDESALGSYAGRFIQAMQREGYTGISVTGYRGFIGEVNNKKTQLIAEEGILSKLYGTEVCELNIVQEDGRFRVEHPKQFFPIDYKKIAMAARDSLMQRDFEFEKIKQASDTPSFARSPIKSSILTMFLKKPSSERHAILQSLRCGEASSGSQQAFITLIAQQGSDMIALLEAEHKRDIDSLALDRSIAGTTVGTNLCRFFVNPEFEKASDETAEKASDETAEKASDETAEKASDETAEKASDETAWKASDETAWKASDETSGKTSDETSGKASDETSGKASDETPERYRQPGA